MNTVACRSWWQDSAGQRVGGPIDYRHMFIPISSMWVPEGRFHRKGHTCEGAMGYSFAAGTTDGKARANLCQGLQSLLQRLGMARIDRMSCAT